MRVLNICLRLGATLRANTVVDLEDGSTVNFVYEVTGLRSFNSEFKRARRLRWLELRVLPLDVAAEPCPHRRQHLVGEVGAPA